MSAKLRLIYKTAQECTGKTAADVTELSFKRCALKKTVIKNWGDSLFYLILRRSIRRLLSLRYQRRGWDFRFKIGRDIQNKQNKQTETLSKYFLTKASLSTKKTFYKKREQ